MVHYPRQLFCFLCSPPLFLSFPQYVALLRSWKQISSRRSKICNSSPWRIMKAHRRMTPWGWYCFDIVILANADATEPWVKDGRSLAWWSHDIPRTATQAADEQSGEIVWARA